MTTHRKRQTHHKSAHRRVTALVLFALALIALTSCAKQDDPALGDAAFRPTIPPIDLTTPKQIETATFALG